MRVRACCRSTRLSLICVAQREEVTKLVALDVFEKHVGRGIIRGALEALTEQQEQQGVSAQVLRSPATLLLPRARAHVMDARQEGGAPITLHAHGEDAIRVEWTLPRGMDKNVSDFTAAAVSLKADGDSTWRRVDAATGKLDRGPDALPVMLPSTECVVRGVDPSVKYFAKVRLADKSGWGPDSAPSDGLTLASLRPSAPAKPVLKAVDETTMCVLYDLPPKQPGAPDHTLVGVYVRAGDGAWQAVDAATSALAKPGTCEARSASCSVADVKGLSADVTYHAVVRVKNACGWGPESAVSEGLNLASLRPSAPAKPLLEAVSETAMRVHFTMPPKLPGAPDHDWVRMYLRTDGGEWQALDARTWRLVKLGDALELPASLTVADVKGLSAGETYHAKMTVLNLCGRGDYSPRSDRVKLPGPEAETTSGGTPNATPKKSGKRTLDQTTSPPAAREAKTASTGARSESRLPATPVKRPKMAVGLNKLTKTAEKKAKKVAADTAGPSTGPLAGGKLLVIDLDTGEPVVH